MSDLFLINVFVIGFLVLVALFLHHLWESTKQDINQIIMRDVVDDFEVTAYNMRFLSFTECDNAIDEFEQRWKPFISADKLRHFVGKLIEAQFQNNLVS